MGQTVNANDLMIDKKALEKQAKEIRQYLFTIRQQALAHGRQRFFELGEIAEMEVTVKVAGKSIRLVYRYDALNDSIYPVGQSYA
jgi:hypothetical protein